uniref:Uncharacterized protein n=1 Tax=Tetraselmis sp. GSL018 TaxID=582737 RepID=A0A061S0Z2_9CHLO
MHTNRRNRSSQPIQGKTMTVPDYQAAFPVSEWVQGIGSDLLGQIPMLSGITGVRRKRVCILS